jgi:hypothetical protein
MAEPIGSARAKARTRRQARLALNAVAITMADYLAQIVPSRTDQHAAPQRWVTIARDVTLLDTELRLRCVTLALEDGATWEDIAEVFGLDEDAESMHDTYGDAFERWQRGEPRSWSKPWKSAGLPTDVDDGDADMMTRVQALWLRRRGITPVPRPSTGGL